MSDLQLGAGVLPVLSKPLNKTTTPWTAPANSKLKTSAGPVIAKKDDLTDWEAELYKHLQAIEDGGVVRVSDFRDAIGADLDAVEFIRLYVAQKLVERKWYKGAGRYSLTSVGRKRLAELRSRTE